MIWAVIMAPRWAIKAQWELQLKAEERKRRLDIYTTLMATRGNAIHFRHVEALNMIDVQFSSDSDDDKAVYLTHLTETGKEAEAGNNSPTQLNTRENHRQDLLAELLNKMGHSLGYGFDHIYLKERAYYPQGHGEQAADALIIRKNLVEISQGKKSLKIVLQVVGHEVDGVVGIFLGYRVVNIRVVMRPTIT